MWPLFPGSAGGHSPVWCTDEAVDSGRGQGSIAEASVGHGPLCQAPVLLDPGKKGHFVGLTQEPNRGPTSRGRDKKSQVPNTFLHFRKWDLGVLLVPKGHLESQAKMALM